MSACPEKHVNGKVVRALLVASLTTAVGYTVWSFVTFNLKLDWSKKRNYLVMFGAVAIGLIVANIVFTLIFQRSQLLICPVDQREPAQRLENQPVFI